MVTQMEIHQKFTYDAETGQFSHIDVGRNTKGVKNGDRAGFIHKSSGYRFIKFAGKAYPEHRFAWSYMTGQWLHGIDHINGDRTDNRFANLRPASNAENSQNRKARFDAKSQFRGVSWSGGKWSASITKDGRRVNLGSFDDLEQAKSARVKAEAELFTHSTRVMPGVTGPKET